jgi:hypothetical protein
MSDTDWVASVGVTLLLIAFFANQRGLMSERSLAYLLLNLFGAGIAGLAAWMGGIIPFVVLECVWAGVAIFGLIDLARQRAARGAVP